MVRARDDLNKTREEEIRTIERRKTKHIAALVAAHEKAFGDIKMYYNEITHSNLDLIKTLKDEVEELRTKEALHERNMFSIAQVGLLIDDCN
jgi:ribulose 1,5-bisphosphate carboxylase large subunit-like protein